jgi:hypothetical protein
MIRLDIPRDLIAVRAHLFQDGEHVLQKDHGLLSRQAELPEILNSLPLLRNPPLAILDMALGALQISLGVVYGSSILPVRSLATMDARRGKRSGSPLTTSSWRAPLRQRAALLPVISDCAILARSLAFDL